MSSWKVAMPGRARNGAGSSDFLLEGRALRMLRAEAALADYEDLAPELVAPIGGSVVSLDLKVGENAIPGQPAVILADLWDLDRFAECSECFERRRSRLEAMNHDATTTPRLACAACGWG